MKGTVQAWRRIRKLKEWRRIGKLKEWRRIGNGNSAWWRPEEIVEPDSGIGS